MVKLLLLLTILKLFDVATSSGWMVKPLVLLNYFSCYLSFIDRKVAVLFLKNLLHNVYSTLLVQVPFLVDNIWWYIGDKIRYCLDVSIPYPFSVIIWPKKLICFWNNLHFFLWLWYHFLLIFETVYVNDLHVNRSHLHIV